MSNTLITFIKNPELGKVKTRLAQSVGPERALGIYRKLLAHTRNVCSQVSAQRLLFYSSYVDHNDDWPAVAFQKQLQTPGDLGERMKAAFAQAFQDNDGPVLIVGSDCAQLTPAILEAAFTALQTHDFVIGPAEDGGYYLIGMRQFHPQVFTDIAWSTEQVFPQTTAIIDQLGANYSLLPTLSDIDYLEDWETYGGLI